VLIVKIVGDGRVKWVERVGVDCRVAAPVRLHYASLCNSLGNGDPDDYLPIHLS